MVGMHGRAASVLGTVCIGASLLAGGSVPVAATASTAAVAPGGGMASASMFQRASRNRPSPGFQFGLSKEEQDYLFGPRQLKADPGRHSKGRNLAS